MIKKQGDVSVFSRRAKYVFVGLVFGLTTAVLFAQLNSFALAEPVTTDNIAKKIAEARTPADHKAIAAFYRAQAEEADAKIKMHERMKQSYKSVDKTANLARWHRRYCDSLINSFRTAKDDYENLAEMHEEASE